MNLFPNYQNHPILFEDIYIKNSVSSKYLEDGKISFAKLK